MDSAQARRIAEQELAEWNAELTPDRLAHPTAQHHDPDDEFVVASLAEHSRAWIVYYASRRWVRTRNVADALVGASPLVIEKATGTTHRYGSSPSEHAKFLAWTDPSPTEPGRS